MMFTNCSFLCTFSTTYQSKSLGSKLPQFTFIDLFCGIGGFHQAAAANGGKCLFASDIDAEARKAYSHNYHIVPEGDITDIDVDAIP